MMLNAIHPLVVISDALVGWDVTVVPEFDPEHFNRWFDDRQFAHAYARGVAVGSGWTVKDETTSNAIGVIGGVA